MDLICLGMLESTLVVAYEMKFCQNPYILHGESDDLFKYDVYLHMSSFKFKIFYSFSFQKQKERACILHRVTKP